jgi:hypothetical protein
MGFYFIAEHVPGTHNILADHLSRNLLSSFLSKAPHMDPRPTPIPSGAVTLLLDSELDWLSETWTSLFNSILSKV